MPSRRAIAYGAICVLSAIGYGIAAILVRSDHSRSDLTLYLSVFTLLACLWAAALAVARSAPPTHRTIFVVALVFRLLLVPAGFDAESGAFRRLLLYDDDIWRYLWEGHTWFAGVNPLQTPPEALEEYELEITDPALHAKLYADPAWGEIYDNIGYREYASPYAYTAQAVFALAHVLRPGSVVAFKLLIIAFDMGVLWLLARLCRRLGQNDFALVAYGWSPLVIKEFAGSGHLDSILVFFVMAAVCSAGKVAASGWLALSTLVKPTPLVFVPALFRRWGWAGVVAPLGVLALIAANPPGGMKAYAAEWSFNPALARLLPIHRPTEVLFPLVVVGLLAGLALSQERRRVARPPGTHGPMAFWRIPVVHADAGAVVPDLDHAVRGPDTSIVLAGVVGLDLPLLPLLSDDAREPLVRGGRVHDPARGLDLVPMGKTRRGLTSGQPLS